LEPLTGAQWTPYPIKTPLISEAPLKLLASGARLAVFFALITALVVRRPLRRSPGGGGRVAGRHPDPAGRPILRGRAHQGRRAGGRRRRAYRPLAIVAKILLVQLLMM